MTYEVTVKEVQPQTTLTIRTTATRDQLGPLMGEILPAVWQYATSQGFEMTGPPFSRYHEFSNAGVDVEAGAPFKATSGQGRIQVSQLPGGKVASVLHFGPYDTLHAAYMALENWFQTHGHTMAGAPWEVYLTDPDLVPNPAEWQTEVLWPMQ